jgi:tellurite methyltransferase
VTTPLSLRRAARSGAFCFGLLLFWYSTRFYDEQFKRQAAAEYEPERDYDCVVAIGLFMFLPCAVTPRQLKRALAAVRPNAIAVVNVLIGGTTYMGMFDEEGGYCLFGEDELADLLEGWQMLDDRIETFDAPGGTTKRFRTRIARRPLR